MNYQQGLLQPDRGRLSALGGQFILGAVTASFAILRERAFAATWPPRQAHGSSQLHQCLIPPAWIAPVKQTVGFCLDLRFVLVEQADDDAANVSIHSGVRQPEGDARHGRSGVVADPGQFPDRVVLAWETTGIDDFPGGFLKVASPRVVAQAAPDGQNLRLRLAGKCFGIWKSGQESLVIWNYCGNTSLLKHDLGDPDIVRIAGAPPR